MRTKAEDRAASQARAAAFANLCRSGKTLQEIGDQFGITRERVRQIITKQFGPLVNEGGSRARADKARADKIAARDARCLRQRGCTYEQYSPLQGKVSRAFIQQKQSAKGRGIGWNLTFWEWWTIWLDSGRWGQRGRNLGQYVMCRYGDSGPYEVGNVYIDTVSANCVGRPKSGSNERNMHTAS